MIFEDYDLDAKELGGTLSSMEESEKNGEVCDFSWCFLFWLLVGVVGWVGWVGWVGVVGVIGVVVVVGCGCGCWCCCCCCCCLL